MAFCCRIPTIKLVNQNRSHCLCFSRVAGPFCPRQVIYFIVLSIRLLANSSAKGLVLYYSRSGDFMRVPPHVGFLNRDPKVENYSFAGAHLADHGPQNALNHAQPEIEARTV